MKCCYFWFLFLGSEELVGSGVLICSEVVVFILSSESFICTKLSSSETLEALSVWTVPMIVDGVQILHVLLEI